MTEVRSVTRSTASLSGLVDLLDAVIADGVTVAGDLVIAVDGIDLVRLDLRLLLLGVEGVPATDGRP